MELLIVQLSTRRGIVFSFGHSKMCDAETGSEHELTDSLTLKVPKLIAFSYKMKPAEPLHVSCVCNYGLTKCDDTPLNRQ